LLTIVCSNAVSASGAVICADSILRCFAIELSSRAAATGERF
jgi:hypothetical protein